MVSVSSRAYRALRSLESFKMYDSPDDAPKEDLPNIDDLVGVYKNPSENKDEILVVAEKGIFLKSGSGWIEILFSDIAEVGSPKDKNNAEILTLKMKDGVTRLLPVRGGNERFRDVYSFHRFMIGVLSDQQK